MSYTLGPWEIAARDPLFECRRIFSGTILVAAVGRSDASEAQQDADALLIAAAPDMYEALKFNSGQPAKARDIMERNGLAITDLSDRYQKLAFTLYTMLVEGATQAEEAIEKAGSNDM